MRNWLPFAAMPFLSCGVLAQQTPDPAAGPKVDMNHPAIIAFVNAENASRDRAQAKYAALIADTQHEFNGRLDLEISQAEKTDDPALTKPDWPEVMCDRVYNKHKERWQRLALREQEIAAAEASSEPTTPAPAPEPAAPAAPSEGVINFTNAVGTIIVDGSAWKGTVHQYKDGKISVTADVSAHKLVWISVNRLSAESRGWLGLGSAADKDAFEVAAKQAREERRHREEIEQKMLQLRMQDRHNRAMEAIARERMEKEAADRAEALELEKKRSRR